MTVVQMKPCRQAGGYLHASRRRDPVYHLPCGVSNHGRGYFYSVLRPLGAVKGPTESMKYSR
jgi:hypothetical protein